MRPLELWNRLLNFILILFITFFFGYISCSNKNSNLTLRWFKSLVKHMCMRIGHLKIHRSHSIPSKMPRRLFFCKKWKESKTISLHFRGPMLKNYWKWRDFMDLSSSVAVGSAQTGSGTWTNDKIPVHFHRNLIRLNP